eukprot:2901434-Prymnesium_polylepis.1
MRTFGRVWESLGEFGRVWETEPVVSTPGCAWVVPPRERQHRKTAQTACGMEGYVPAVSRLYT